MYTLGINAVYHDPSACLVSDGQLIAAAEEERFTHIKHGKRPLPFTTWELPFHAIDYCLKEAAIRLVDVAHIAYSYDPFQLLGAHRREATITLPLEPSAHPTSPEWEAAWDPLFLASIVNAPRQLASGAPHHLQERLSGASADGPYRWHFIDHHLTHAASAFHASPFDEAAVLTLDGRGERATTSYSLGRGTTISRLGQVDMPHSLGLLYEEVTEYLGFLRSSDEYKVMALASFGSPRYLQDFRQMIQLGERGQYTIAPPELEERFGPRREPGGPLDARHYDIASSLQVALEEAALAIADWLHGASGVDDLCLAGGVALNCVMNARLRDRGPFRRIWVQPAAGDAGTSLGAALWIDASERGTSDRSYEMDHAYLGPSFDDREIEAFLRWSKLPYRPLDDVPGDVANLLAQDKVVGWFQGRMEFGPRALGNRSMLARATDQKINDWLNKRLDRSEFMPFAPSVLAEHADAVFHGVGKARHTAEFMTITFDVRDEWKPRIPAVVHVDGTARPQLVRREVNPLYHRLISAYHSLSGIPLVLNTSFNVHEEPIVCAPPEAVRALVERRVDCLAIGPFWLEN